MKNSLFSLVFVLGTAAALSTSAQSLNTNTASTDLNKKEVGSADLQ